MTEKMNKWVVTVAKIGELEIEANSESGVYNVLNDEVLTNLIQWEDAWSVVDIEKVSASEE